MADQTMLIAGPSASTFCYGLVDTGKFIRIYPDKRATHYSRLFGDGIVEMIASIFRDDSDEEYELKANKYGTVLEDIPDYRKAKENRDGKRKHRSSTTYNSPASEKSYDFAVRGNQIAVTTVMGIIRAHKREFETTKTAENIIRVNCVGSPARTQATLSEIRERL